MSYYEEKAELKKQIAENNLSVKSIAENVPYYVYFHYLDGDIFYIGKGSGLRCLEFKGRSKAWVDFVDGREDEVCVCINRAFSCENEAFNYESKAIMTCESKFLVNVTHNDADRKIDKSSSRKVKSVYSRARINVFVSKSLVPKLNKIRNIQRIEMDLLIALISKINHENINSDGVKIAISNKEARDYTGNNNLYNSKIRKHLEDIKLKYGIICNFYTLNGGFEVEFSKSFSSVILDDSFGYFSINTNEILSLESMYSRFLYIHLSNVKMEGALNINKSDLISSMPVSSYNDYDFLRKALLPAVEDNSNYFVNLKLSNLRGNMLPEVCKFNFFKKRSTKMERELALATRENIFELIEEYR